MSASQAYEQIEKKYGSIPTRKACFLDAEVEDINNVFSSQIDNLEY